MELKFKITDLTKQQERADEDLHRACCIGFTAAAATLKTFT